MPRRGTKVRRAGDGVCCFCCIGDERELELGKLHRSNNQTVHYYCLLFSSGLPQNGDDDEGIMGFLPADIEKERQRGRKLKCCYCHQPGATIGCSEKLCRRTYHYSCGEQHSAAFKFNSDFRSYCGQHREWQRGLTLALKAEEEEFEFVCPICIEDIPQDPRHMVWAPCCNAFLHKSCIRQLALSAGYFFKCPLCNDKDAFVPEMQDAGIYVPEKDASWELEPNAFSELLERPVHCDATPCKCLDGPKVDEVGTRWEILLCNLCGSSGVHVACGGLPMSCTEWTCPACAKTLEESVRRMQSEVRQRRLSQRNKKMAQSIMSGGNGRAERQSTFHEFRAQSLISAQNQRLETVLKETGSSVHGGTGRQSTMHKFTVSESTTDHTSSLVDLNIHSATLTSVTHGSDRRESRAGEVVRLVREDTNQEDNIDVESLPAATLGKRKLDSLGFVEATPSKIRQIKKDDEEEKEISKIHHKEEEEEEGEEDETDYEEEEVCEELEDYNLPGDTVIRKLEEEGEELGKELQSLKLAAVSYQERLSSLRLTEDDVVRMAKESSLARYKENPIARADIRMFYRYNLPLSRMLHILAILKAVVALRKAKVITAANKGQRRVRAAGSGRGAGRGRRRAARGTPDIKETLLKSAVSQSLSSLVTKSPKHENRSKEPTDTYRATDNQASASPRIYHMSPRSTSKSLHGDELNRKNSKSVLKSGDSHSSDQSSSSKNTNSKETTTSKEVSQSGACRKLSLENTVGETPQDDDEAMETSTEVPIVSPATATQESDGFVCSVYDDETPAPSLPHLATPLKNTALSLPHSATPPKTSVLLRPHSAPPPKATVPSLPHFATPPKTTAPSLPHSAPPKTTAPSLLHLATPPKATVPYPPHFATPPRSTPRTSFSYNFRACRALSYKLTRNKAKQSVSSTSSPRECMYINSSPSKFSPSESSLSKSSPSKFSPSKSSPSKSLICESIPTKSSPRRSTPNKSTGDESSPSKISRLLVSRIHQSSPSQATPIKATSTKATPIKATPTKATPTKASPTKATPTKATPTKATPTKATPTKATPTKATPTKATPSQSVPCIPLHITLTPLEATRTESQLSTYKLTPCQPTTPYQSIGHIPELQMSLTHTPTTQTSTHTRTSTSHSHIPHAPITSGSTALCVRNLTTLTPSTSHHTTSPSISRSYEIKQGKSITRPPTLSLCSKMQNTTPSARVPLTNASTAHTLATPLASFTNTLHTPASHTATPSACVSQTTPSSSTMPYTSADTSAIFDLTPCTPTPHPSIPSTSAPNSSTSHTKRRKQKRKLLVDPKCQPTLFDMMRKFRTKYPQQSVGASTGVCSVSTLSIRPQSTNFTGNMPTGASFDDLKTTTCDAMKTSTSDNMKTSMTLDTDEALLETPAGPSSRDLCREEGAARTRSFTPYLCPLVFGSPEYISLVQTNPNIASLLTSLEKKVADMDMKPAQYGMYSDKPRKNPDIAEGSTSHPLCQQRVLFPCVPSEAREQAGPFCPWLAILNPHDSHSKGPTEQTTSPSHQPGSLRSGGVFGRPFAVVLERLPLTFMTATPRITIVTNNIIKIHTRRPYMVPVLSASRVKQGYLETRLKRAAGYRRQPDEQGADGSDHVGK